MLEPVEIAIIGIAAFLFFGPKKLPEIARSLGQGIKEFKKATREGVQEFEKSVELSGKACPSCGNPLKDEKTAFCPQCGKAASPSQNPNPL